MIDIDNASFQFICIFKYFIIFVSQKFAYVVLAFFES